MIATPMMGYNASDKCSLSENVAAAIPHNEIIVGHHTGQPNPEVGFSDTHNTITSFRPSMPQPHYPVVMRCLFALSPAHPNRRSKII